MDDTRYQAENCNDHQTCGHLHRSRDAAERCLPHVFAIPHAPGACIRVVRYHRESRGFVRSQCQNLP